MECFTCLYQVFSAFSENMLQWFHVAAIQRTFFRSMKKERTHMNRNGFAAKMLLIPLCAVMQMVSGLAPVSKTALYDGIRVLAEESLEEVQYSDESEGLAGPEIAEVSAQLNQTAGTLVRAASPAAYKTADGIEYITPEDFGAKGNGVTDDTAAFEKCMKAPGKYVLLTGKYLITRYIKTSVEKHFYAIPSNGNARATIICNPKSEINTLSFNNVTFENVQFYSTLLRKGTSPHGEKYQRTSNTVFVEVWNGSGRFENCEFINALVAIRGRKSTGSTTIPQNINVNNCSFTECKIPIQGYCKKAEVRNSSFINDGELYRKLNGAAQNTSLYNGDVYSGDHCIYMEAYGCESLTVTNCYVSTLNSESGCSFQIYGTPAANAGTPTLSVKDCNISSNGVVSVRKADIVVENTLFDAQKNDSYIMWAENGSARLINSEFNHAYAFSYASTTVKPYAADCTFRLKTELLQTRSNFPYVSENCTYVNWGGNVRVDGTSFTNCIFTSDAGTVLNRLYINTRSSKNISIVNSKFRKGSTIVNNSSAVSKYSGCSTFD